MRIFLTGMMGSGKSYWMQKLASRLSLTGYDLDTLVTEREQKSIADIFTYQGETYFRESETAVLRSLAAEDGFILSTGGGTPCFHNNMKWMNEHGLTIFLDEPPAQLYARIVPRKVNRPLVASLSNTELKNYLEAKRQERLPCYETSKAILRGDEINEANLIRTIQKYQDA